MKGGAGLAVHGCATAMGDSGAPILSLKDGRYTLVAIHVASAQGQATPMGLAVPTAGILRAAASPHHPRLGALNPPIARWFWEKLVPTERIELSTSPLPDVNLLFRPVKFPTG